MDAFNVQVGKVDFEGLGTDGIPGTTYTMTRGLAFGRGAKFLLVEYGSLENDGSTADSLAAVSDSSQEGVAYIINTHTFKAQPITRALANAATSAGYLVGAPQKSAEGGSLAVDSSNNPTSDPFEAKDAIEYDPTDIKVGSYFWVQIFGRGKLNVLNGAVAGAKLYTSGTAGALDDGSSSQNLVDDIYLRATASAAGLFDANFSYPCLRRP